MLDQSAAFPLGLSAAKKGLVGVGGLGSLDI